ncbi:hypothetical protein [Candidatus Tisiphia endosymbiont of Nemotelus uliginosus]|uniref:hypothetical protein n=1 Tax=Candidatus Tisiphia endosymbiont of Nemotelus uliginosus TaxID=3077926 RepID=UPI0035C8F05B
MKDIGERIDDRKVRESKEDVKNIFDDFQEYVGRIGDCGKVDLLFASKIETREFKMVAKALKEMKDKLGHAKDRDERSNRLEEGCYQIKHICQNLLLVSLDGPLHSSQEATPSTSQYGSPPPVQDAVPSTSQYRPAHASLVDLLPSYDIASSVAGLPSYEEAVQYRSSIKPINRIGQGSIAGASDVTSTGRVSPAPTPPATSQNNSGRPSPAR